jgi:hypothetical protein
VIICRFAKEEREVRTKVLKISVFMNASYRKGPILVKEITFCLGKLRKRWLNFAPLP